MDMAKLITEVTTDPLSRGYAGMTDTEVANSLNSKTQPGPERSVIPSHEVFEAIVQSEWTALSAAEKQRVQTIVSMGSVNIKGTNTRAALAAAFGQGTTTRANLIALQAGPKISRAEELGLGGVVGDGHVQSARGG